MTLKIYLISLFNLNILIKYIKKLYKDVNLYILYKLTNIIKYGK